MTTDSENRRAPVLDPVERVTEVIFGVLMALTFTGSLSIASADQEVRTMMFAALGCNLAWGLTDAVMYLISTMVERQRKVSLLKQLQGTRDTVAAHLLIRQALPDRLVAGASDQAVESIHRRLLAITPARAVLRRDDFAGALGVLLLVVLSTFPVVVPFMLSDDIGLALRISNALAVLTMFIGGLILGRYAGGKPLTYGFAMAGIGIALVTIIIALGG
jgi:VIT1/CCC1 family predicted Fe2+/Mn2+ transporter